MKTLKEALFSKRTLDSSNKYGITQNDLTGCFESFPLGVVVKMLEEAERQDNLVGLYWDENKASDLIRIAKMTGDRGHLGLFSWTNTKDSVTFWERVLLKNDWNFFFRKYPEYKKIK